MTRGKIIYIDRDGKIFSPVEFNGDMYRSKELGKSEIHAYQASKRGGHLYCELLENGRIKISGETTLVAISDIVVDF